MFCIDAEYVLVCYIRVYCFVPLSKDIRQTSKKLVAIIAIHSFLFISSTVYSLLFSGCKINKME